MAKKSPKTKAVNQEAEMRHRSEDREADRVAREGSDVENFNRLATSVENPVVPVEADAQKVRADDLRRSVEEMAKVAHHSAEALVVAGLGKPRDAGLVAAIAAVQCPGATGSVGWVTATKIEAAINEYKK